jgi:hypothetical protein
MIHADADGAGRFILTRHQYRASYPRILPP